MLRSGKQYEGTGKAIDTNKFNLENIRECNDKLLEDTKTKESQRSSRREKERQVAM